MRNNEDTFDRIQNYYLKEETLNPKELEMVSRYEMVFALYCKHMSKKETISKYMAIQNSNGNRLSIPTAYRDLETAEKLFAPMREYKKEHLKLVMVEQSMKDIKLIESRIARGKLSTSDLCILLNQKDRALKRIGDYTGINREDPNLPDFSKLLPNTYEITIPQTMQRMLKKMMQGGVSDFTGIEFDDIEIIDEDGSTLDNSTTEG